jgi:asparagine synthase (glutamine-hydrolysing)
MLDVMKHRGRYTAMDADGPAVLGQCSWTARMARHSVKGRDFIVLFDGEIYNCGDLEETLRCEDCEEELILHAYLRWGVGFPRHLQGAFAIAIWDVERQRLTLARDRFGARPLFFHQQGDTFAFASEIKGLLAHPAIPAQINLDGIREIFALLPARTPGCGVFRGIDELLPAHTQTLEQNLSVRSAFCRLGYKPHTDSIDDTADKVRQMLVRSAKRQVSGANMLSGGLDSSVLSAICAQTGDITTYSVDYAESQKYFTANLFQPNHDGEYIDAMVRTLHADHRRVILEADELAASLEEAMRLRDLPGMADIDTSLLLFCREIAKEHSAVISGEGADEVFGGYPWFYRSELTNNDQFPWSPDVAYRQTFLSGEFRGILNLSEYAHQKLRLTMMTAPEYGGDDPAEARIRSLMYLNMRWFMANLIDRSDRMGQAAGVTIRMPFADEELLDYVFNIPWNIKFLNGQEKGLLRKAFDGLLPEKVLHRKKSPYPKTYHPAYTDAAKRILREEMKPDSSLFALVSKEALHELLSGGSIGRPWFGQLMSGPQLIGFMAQLGMWLRTYKVKILV